MDNEWWVAEPKNFWWASFPWFLSIIASFLCAQSHMLIPHDLRSDLALLLFPCPSLQVAAAVCGEGFGAATQRVIDGAWTRSELNFLRSFIVARLGHPHESAIKVSWLLKQYNSLYRKILTQRSWATSTCSGLHWGIRNDYSGPRFSWHWKYNQDYPSARTSSEKGVFAWGWTLCQDFGVSSSLFHLGDKSMELIAICNCDLSR